MKLTIHRGTHEIGGTCVEISANNSRMIIDVGLPLPDYENLKAIKNIPDSLTPSLTQKHPPIKGILISHAHLDHYGLLSDLSSEIPIYASKGTAILMKATLELSGKIKLWRQPVIFENQKPFEIGDFVVTPCLMDHSAFDSYAFLIRAEGKNIFYSGDFREHGRKPNLLHRLLSKLPQLDYLLLEGTMVGQKRESEFLSESELENRFIKSIKATEGIVFVTVSSQNIDRLVTIFRACKRSGRSLIIDPYTSEILDRIKEVSNKLPHPSWLQIHVCYPKYLCEWLKRNGNEKVVSRHRIYGKSWKYFSENASRMVMLIKPHMFKQINKYFDLNKSRWIYSMWSGYLERDKKMSRFSNEMKESGAIFEYLHTSGHANINTLEKVVTSLKPKVVIPIHTFYPERYEGLFGGTIVSKVLDGVEISI